MPDPPNQVDAGAPLVGARYQIINELGRGGMGAVYRALDRLNGRVITLKRLRFDAWAARASFETGSQGRMALAREFRLLASLRHPNINSILDYGFDEDGEPFLTMDLQENAATILEASLGQPMAIQIDLLVQALRAVLYLHRHGIIHRDLKPENILVVANQVKVLDFGLSIHQDAAEAERGGLAGTLRYLAPEIFRGDAPTPQCDLFALGMVGYEMLVGEHPFADVAAAALIERIESTHLPRAEDGVDPRLRPILERLLAKRPEDRYRDADQVIAALEEALQQLLEVETPATRESLLQSAPFVGRGKELVHLTDLLRDAAAGGGSAWLVGGESGVGKSRLLEELRTRALVDGILAVRGQAASQGGGPYHVWREIVSSLVLHVEVDDAQAAILKTIVPTIDTLLRRPVDDAPDADPEAAQTRLMLTVEEIVRLQPAPVLLILEDMQWVGSESQRMWNWLAHAAGGMPLLVTGSFRREEAPDLPGVLQHTDVLMLDRLDRDAIATLSEAMIGPAGRRPDVVALLERETEGIPFFVVEVVRTLAEAEGRLGHIGQARLPERVVSGGMRQVIQRRLDRIPADDLPILQAAAVSGRALDPTLLQTFDRHLAVDEWLQRCAEVTVLEPRDDQWQFAHDKLREQLLEGLGAETRVGLHRRVAEAIEIVYPGRSDYVAALAHHWQEAGDTSRELPYAERAGVMALQSGACREAIGHLERALTLLDVVPPTPGNARPRPATARRFDPNAGVDAGSPEFRRGTLEGALADACFRVGDIDGCRGHGARALAHFRQPVPTGRLGWARAIGGQGCLRVLQRTWPVHATDVDASARVASEVARVHMRLADVAVLSLQPAPFVWSALRVVNHCEPTGPSAELAWGYIALGFTAQTIPLPRLARSWCERALDLAERSRSPRGVAYALSRLAVQHIMTCNWRDADRDLDRAMRLTEELRDVRLWEECRQLAAAVGLYSARFPRALEFFRESHRSTERSGDKQVRCWAQLGQADIMVRLGQPADALPMYARALAHLDYTTLTSEAIWGRGMSALARLRTGDARGAYDDADQALTQILAQPPIAYWVQHGTAATAEVLLSLWEHSHDLDDARRAHVETRATQACAAMRRFARPLPLGRPHAALWDGLRAWVGGRRRRALRLWGRCLELSERLGTPYEAARAHLELARHLPHDDPRHGGHLARAIEQLEALGCATELDWARALASPASR